MAPTSPSNPQPPPPLDPWTPDQESALLRALVHYKPVGLHAHFRMLAVHSALLNSGTTDPDTVHTRIPGIWDKLRSLYDLKALDEREDAVFEGEGKRARWRDFELGDGIGKEGGEGEERGFEVMMWDRRLANGGEGTPGGSEWGDDDDDEKLPTTMTTTTEKEKADATTVVTDEARSSPVPSMFGRGTRSTRTKGRVNVLKDETDAESPSTGRASSRRTSKATNSEVDDGDVVMEDADEDGEEDGDLASEIGDSNSSEEVDDGEEERRSSAKRGRGSGKRGRGGKRGRRRG